MGALTTFVAGTKAKAGEINTNFEQSYYQGALSSTMTYAAITVGSSSTVIKALNSSRKSILINNNSSEELFIGATGVTITTGKRVEVGKSIYIQDTEAVYGVTSSGSANIRYLEVT